MVFVLNIAHGHVPSNEIPCQLQPKKTKVMLCILAVNIVPKSSLLAVAILLTRQIASVFNVGMSYG